jgi:hypothetical protein
MEFWDVCIHLNLHSFASFIQARLIFTIKTAIQPYRYSFDKKKLL